MKYDELMDLLVYRRSCRDFQSEMVPDGLVLKIMKAGLWCPSSHNKQDTIIIRVKDIELKEKLRKSTSLIMTNGPDFDPFYGAPEILIVARKNGTDSDRDLGNMDGTLVMSNMILAAETLGLATCWVNTAQINHMFTWRVLPEIISKATKTDVQKPDDDIPYIGVGYLALGYRNGFPDTPLPRKNKRIFEI